MPDVYKDLACEALLLQRLLRRNHNQFSRLKFFRQFRAVAKILCYDIMSEKSLGLLESAASKLLSEAHSSKGLSVAIRVEDSCADVIVDCMTVISNCLTILTFCEKITSYLCEETKKQNFVVMYTLLIALGSKIAHMVSIAANNFNDYYLKLRKRIDSGSVTSIEAKYRDFDKEHSKALDTIASLLLYQTSHSDNTAPASGEEDVGMCVQGSGGGPARSRTSSYTVTVIQDNIKNNCGEIKKRSIKLESETKKRKRSQCGHI